MQRSTYLDNRTCKKCGRFDFICQCDYERCPSCGFKVPIVTSRAVPEPHWAYHTILGNLTSGGSPECRNSGQMYTT